MNRKIEIDAELLRAGVAREERAAEKRRALVRACRWANEVEAASPEAGRFRPQP